MPHPIILGQLCNPNIALNKVPSLSTYIGPLGVGEDAVVVVAAEVAVERGGPAQGLHPPEEAVQRPRRDHGLAHTHTVVEEPVSGWSGDVQLWRPTELETIF